MSLSKPSTPATPDYTAAAQQQGQDALTNTYISSQLSNPNVSTPYGTVTRTNPTLQDLQTGQAGNGTESVTLSPAQQALLNSQQTTQQGVASAGNNLLGSLSNLTGQVSTAGLPSVSQGADQINSNVVNALYNQQTQYLDPQFSQGATALSAQLAAQGLDPNDEAYKNAMTNFNNTKQQAYSNAMDNATSQGTQAGLAATQENLANRQEGFNENQVNQFTPLNEIQQILGLSSPNVPSATSTSPAATAAAPDLLSALSSTYASQLGNYNANTAATNNTIGTLGNLGVLAYLAA